MGHALAGAPSPAVDQSILIAVAALLVGPVGALGMTTVAWAYVRIRSAPRGGDERVVR